MSEPLVRLTVHWSQRGFVKGRQIATHVVQVESAFEECLNDVDSEPTALVLGFAAALPSVEWPCMRWALVRLGVPEHVCRGDFSHARACLCAPSVGWRRVDPDTFSALLYDPVFRSVWGASPRGWNPRPPRGRLRDRPAERFPGLASRPRHLRLLTGLVFHWARRCS